MDNQTMQKRDEEFILWEANDQYCRENGTLASGQNLPSGTLLMGASSALTRLAANVTDDELAGAVTGFLLHATDATAGAVKVAYLARGPAVVKADLLTYPVETTGDVETAAIASAALLNIIVR